MMGQISRGTGHNCPPSSIQLGVAKVIDQTADLNVYETNMNLLYDALTGIGFDVVRPAARSTSSPSAGGRRVAFCMKAKEYDLILVPSDSFGVPATSAWLLHRHGEGQALDPRVRKVRPRGVRPVNTDRK